MRVRAQDETTTQTYTVTVTRRVSMLTSCDLDAVWCALLTVGVSSNGLTMGYCRPGVINCNYGSLDVGGFTLDQTDYTVHGVRWRTDDTLLALDKVFPDSALPFLTLRIGTYSLALADATAGNSGATWPTPEGFPALGAGDPVTVQLSSAASTDAALSALELADDEGGAVALNETFAPGEAAYTASVANRVGQVTVTPAVSHAFATVDYLDVDGAALADADGGHGRLPGEPGGRRHRHRGAGDGAG